MTDDRPSESWLPLSEAVFRLQYEVATDRGMRRSFLSECLAARRDNQGTVTYDPQLADGSGGLLTTAAVDFEGGHFVYAWTAPSGFQKNLRARPWELAGSSPPYDVGEPAWAHLSERGGQVWRQLMADFSRQVETGAVVVAGRPDSVFAEAREIPADSWPAITVEDWEIGTASASSGERFLGLRARLRGDLGADDAEVPATPAIEAYAEQPMSVGVVPSESPVAAQFAGKAAGRPSTQLDRARDALRRAYPNGPPARAEKSDDALCHDVQKHLDNPANPPSKDTIKRAAGRR